MKTLLAIIEGWWYYLTSNRDARARSKPRTEICSTCNLKDKRLNLCKDCGCFLPAKTRVEDAQCPIGKW